MAGAGQGGAGQNQFAGQNVYQQSSGALTGALGTAAGEAGYQPMRVGAGPNVQAQNVQAGQLSGTNLDPYYNPYEAQVVGNTLSDLERARQISANEMSRQAQAAGAFGGSRSAILESQSNLGYAQQAANTAAQLRQAGYTNAQQMALQDIQARMQADLANQGANLQAGQFNSSQALQAALANQQAGLQASQQRLAAANQLGNLSSLGFNMGQQVQQGMSQQGALQQAQQQQIIDAIKQQYQGYQGQPATSLSYLAQALGAAPVPQTTTTTRQPGLFDYLTLGLSM